MLVAGSLSLALANIYPGFRRPFNRSSHFVMIFLILRCSLQNIVALLFQKFLFFFLYLHNVQREKAQHKDVSSLATASNWHINEVTGLSDRYFLTFQYIIIFF